MRRIWSGDLMRTFFIYFSARRRAGIVSTTEQRDKVVSESAECKLVPLN